MNPQVPKFGFGTALSLAHGPESPATALTESDFQMLVHRALELGVRHFDCAPLYGTQRLLGQTLTSACQSLGIQREQLFITSKLPVNMMRPHRIESSIRSSLKDLQLQYLDCFLIHAPFATKYLADEDFYPLDSEGNLLMDDGNQLESTWLKMAQIKQMGLTKSIGLSNVNADQISRLHKLYKVDHLQSEYHLYHRECELMDFCEELDIHFEAYAALGCPPKAKATGYPISLQDEVVKRIAERRQLTPTQVIIKWLNKQPLSFIIGSESCSQLDENFKAITDGIQLSTEELIELDNRNKSQRLFYYNNYQGLTNHREYPFENN